VLGTFVTKIAAPDMTPVCDVFPLKINVPVSRQQFPTGNSTSLEKLIKLFVTLSQTAGKSIVGVHVVRGPMSLKDPVPFE